MTASWQKVFSGDPRVGYFTQAQVYRDAQDAGEVLAPAQDQGQMDQIIFNSTLNGILQAVFALLTLVVVAHAAVVIARAIRAGRAADHGGTGGAVEARRARRALPDRRGEAGDRRARAAGRRRVRAAEAEDRDGARSVRAWRGRALVPAGVHRRGALGPTTWSTAPSTGTRR